MTRTNAVRLAQQRSHDSGDAYVVKQDTSCERVPMGCAFYVESAEDAKDCAVFTPDPIVYHTDQ